jgi:hypothetical protein
VGSRTIQLLATDAEGMGINQRLYNYIDNQSICHRIFTFVCCFLGVEKFVKIPEFIAIETSFGICEILHMKMSSKQFTISASILVYGTTPNFCHIKGG